MAHGSADPVVPFAAGERSAALLRQHDIAVDWHAYPMAHQVCAEEIADLGDWMDARFRPGTPPRPDMESAPREPWLPDLCRLTRLATMLGVAELVVLVIALAPTRGAAGR
jgi:hypothetical protein